MRRHVLIKPTLLGAFSLFIALSFPSLAEEEFAVDQADSLDMDAFHKSDNKGEKSSNPIIDFFTGKNKSGVKFEGKSLIVKKAYQINDSSLVISAIHALQQEMAKQCPTGWIKDAEWVLPVENDYELHYQFRCVKN